MWPAKLSLLLVFFTFAAHVPALMAWPDEDGAWNSTMGEEFMANNTFRRALTNLNKFAGPCKPTNPIDKCWRCRPNWAQNRQRLADCAVGFGAKAYGGKGGRIYVVTDKSDDDVANPKPGTLRHAVIQKEPLWIIFAKNMKIKLQQELLIQSYKTIDGRGAKVHIAGGAGIMMQNVTNIIIHNLYIHDIVSAKGGLIRDAVDHLGFRTQSDGDGISLFGARNVWLDHLSMKKCEDGLIDAIEGSTAITISNCHWTDHDRVLLFGARDAGDGDDEMRITVIYNHFGKRLVQRMPRVRAGIVHIINNDYTHWNMYAIGGSHHATIISEGNRFIAPPDRNFKQVTHRDAPESEWRKWTWRSKGDMFKNGAFFVESGDPNGVQKLHGLDKIEAKPARAVHSLTRFAGAIGGCKAGKAC
ncbi:Pectate lyase [Bertholletia excelsa]